MNYIIWIIVIVVLFVLFWQSKATENFWGWAPYSWGHGWDRWQGRRGPWRHRYDWDYNS